MVRKRSSVRRVLSYFNQTEAMWMKHKANVCLALEDLDKVGIGKEPEVDAAFHTLVDAIFRAMGSVVTDSGKVVQRCHDCGEEGELTGHMGCQYPQNH